MQRYNIPLEATLFSPFYCLCNSVAQSFFYLCNVKVSRPTYFASMAILLMLILSLIPHHHHEGGAACWVTEICHRDGQTNDCHTSHHDNRHTDAHQCFYQPTATHLSTLRKAASDMGGGFLPPIFWNEAHTPIIYIGVQVYTALPSPTLLASPFCKQISRRGPPLLG